MANESSFSGTALKAGLFLAAVTACAFLAPLVLGAVGLTGAATAFAGVTGAAVGGGVDVLAASAIGSAVLVGVGAATTAGSTYLTHTENVESSTHMAAELDKKRKRDAEARYKAQI